MIINNDNITPTFVLHAYSDEQREKSGDKRDFVGGVTYVQTGEKINFGSEEQLIQFIKDNK